MNFAELKQEVSNIINDDSYEDSIANWVNEAFLQASGEVNLPDLKRIAVISTTEDLSYAQLCGLSDGFSGRLVKLFDQTIDVYGNVESMFTEVQNQSREYNENGAVEMVALEGMTLWYFPIPKPAQQLMAILFSNPKKLVDGSDIPVGFPEIVHRNIGVHGACMLYFETIEDGIEGDKVNTKYHLEMYQLGIQQLKDWIFKHRVNMVTSTLNDPICTQVRS